jgi:hypothetical protein
MAIALFSAALVSVPLIVGWMLARERSAWLTWTNLAAVAASAVMLGTGVSLPVAIVAISAMALSFAIAFFD